MGEVIKSDVIDIDVIKPDVIKSVYYLLLSTKHVMVCVSPDERDEGLYREMGNLAPKESGSIIFWKEEEWEHENEI